MEYKEEKLSRAISAFSRRQILRLLADNELTVKEIAEKTKISVSLASRHLKLLYDLDFLNVRKEFPYKYYSLKVKELKQLLDVYDKVIGKI
jgi:DNA-binding transcriptional ArsR family regulator